MKINDRMITSFFYDGDCMKLSEEWYFTSSQLAVDYGRNIFSIPLLGRNEKKNMLYVLRAIHHALECFSPLNENLLRCLFPQYDHVLREMQVDVIMGLPDCYEAVTQFREEKAVILLDVSNIARDVGYKATELVLKGLLSREFCHLLLYDRDSGLKELEKDYRKRLDKGTFVEGFSELFSYLGIELNDIEWKTVRLKGLQEQCKNLMRKAIDATERKEQENYLEEAFSGVYSNRFGNTCGMMYFAEQWEAEGTEGLMRTLSEGWKGFAAKASR
ncbi:MAG: hypothetical protein Q4B26_21070 [Eubacteriales bacterium]|nr:hypothetical protein [Eubacteriales bacterium]